MNFNFFNFEFESQTTVKLTNILDKNILDGLQYSSSCSKFISTILFFIKISLKSGTTQLDLRIILIFEFFWSQD